MVTWGEPQLANTNADIYIFVIFKVKKVNVKAGDTVNEEDILVELE